MITRYFTGTDDNNKMKKIFKTNNKALLLAGLCAYAVVGTVVADPLKTSKKPNFVWLVSEDNSHSFLNLYSEQGAKMPNVEALAKSGIVFNNAFSNAPVCSTARTTLATGAYAPRLGLNYHRRYTESALPDGLQPIAKYLKDAGYYTSNDVKTDFNFVLDEKNGMWSQSAKGADWRKRAKNQPFFHMQSWTTTHEKTLHFPASDVQNKPTMHDPKAIKLPPVYPDTETFRYTFARYLDNHVALDAEIGKVVDKLKEDGLLEDTFVFYFGDHGGVLPGTKGYAFERGLHVPLVVRIPENFRHLLDDRMQQIVNARIDGFVSFIDFAPTLAHLAGLPLSKQYDGKPFLGPKVGMTELDNRDTAIGYANRFDEKSDMVRTLRKGRFKYIRNFHPMNPDGLFNQYRFKQEGYKEWKKLFVEGKLNKAQAAFFESKSPEALYDIENDPYETKNLAELPKYKAIAAVLRDELTDTLKGMPDLGFYPEHWQELHAFDSPVVFGQKHKRKIERLIDIANLQLNSFKASEQELSAALSSSDMWERYWALISLSSFGTDASSFSGAVEKLLKQEKNALIKARAIEFLALAADVNPTQPMTELIANTDNFLEILEILNIATMLHDVKGYSFDIPFRDEWKNPKKGQPNFFKERVEFQWMDARTKYLRQ